MTVARDAVTESATFTTTTPHTLTHTPVGTPRGVSVHICHGTVSTDLITGTVSYGGVALTRIVTATDTVTELGRVYTYFLGVGIPSGAQTVSIGHSGSADVKIAYIQSVTAAADTEIGASGTVSENVADPTLALDTGGVSSLRCGILYSGVAAPSSVVALAGMETVVAGTSHDFGAFVTAFGEQTTAASGSFNFGFTVAIDDVAMTGIAIQEVAAAFAHLPLFGVRRPQLSLIPFDSND